MTIHLGRSLPNASRDLPGPDARTRLLMHGSLFGLAPGGVYPATTVTGSAVRSYRTLSPLPSMPEDKAGRYTFCGTFPGVAPAGGYPAPYSRGARTFLPLALSRSKAQSSSHLARP